MVLNLLDKPAASGSESAEIYVLGLRYKDPAKTDPRLIDVKQLFQGSAQPQAKVLFRAGVEVWG